MISLTAFSETFFNKFVASGTQVAFDVNPCNVTEKKYLKNCHVLDTHTV